MALAGGVFCFPAFRRMEFMLAHPSDKNKDVARMGHPVIWGWSDMGHPASE
jgi:hypothetical protein